MKSNNKDAALSAQPEHWGGYPLRELLPNAQPEVVDMLLFCPNCFEQHVDEAKPDVCETCGLSEAEHIENGSDDFTAWLNPSHKSHRCSSCNHVWRPSDTPTNGVLKLETKGKADGSAKPVAFANGKDFNDAVEIATPQPEVQGDVCEPLDIKPRRPLNDHQPDGYEESDKDFVENNIEVAVMLLERHLAKPADVGDMVEEK